MKSLERMPFAWVAPLLKRLRVLMVPVVWLACSQVMLPAAAGAAEVRTFSFNGQSFVLEDVSSELKVFLRAMRFNEATERWNVDLVVTNAGARPFLRPILVSIESVANTTGPIQPDGVQPGSPPKPFYVLGEFFFSGSPTLEPGQSTLSRSVQLGFVENAGVPSLQIKIFAVPGGPSYALGVTRTLNEAGQPLPEVTVIEQGPGGSQSLRTDPDYGVVTLGGAPGDYAWKFERAGYWPVWRRGTLLQGAVQPVPNPRLTRRTAEVPIVTGNAGATLADAEGAVRLEFLSLTPGQQTRAALTLLEGQTLPALLPQGWSPMRAFWFGTTNESLSVVAAIRPIESVSPDTTLALVKWNPASLHWEVLIRLQGNGTNAVEDFLAGSGAYALVAPDSGTLAPPTPVEGQALLPSSPPPQPAVALRAAGTVTPTSSPASLSAAAVTGLAQVWATNTTGLLPSGLTLRTEVAESYRLQDGTARFAAPYETFITGYRPPRPALVGSNVLGFAFPVRPQLLVPPGELAGASVVVEVLAPSGFRGGVFDTNGGVVASGVLRVIAEPGDVGRPQAATLRELASTNLNSLLVPAQTLAAAFDFVVAGVLSNQSLTLQVSNLAPNRSFVLGRVLSDVGLNGIEPVERLRSNTNGVLQTLEPFGEERLPGLRRPGQYLLIEVPSAQALITGVVRGADNTPAAGVQVSIAGQPWLTLSGDDGRYRLVAPTGQVLVAAIESASGNAGFADLAVPNPNLTVTADLTAAPRGPRVLTVSPANGASKVSPVTPVLVTFSKAVNPGSLVNGGLQLLGTNGAPIAASLTVNTRGTVATLLPINPLDTGRRFTLQLAATVADTLGQLLEGPRQFSFETARSASRGEVAQLTIFEPGATNFNVGALNVRSLLVGFNELPNKRDVVVAYGSPGTAEPEVPVILVNDTSGETATVLSKPDGSFAGFVSATEDDFISAVFVNANGTRTTVPASRQRFDDGRVGLFRGGGILEAESDGAPVQILVEPGSIQNKSKLKVDIISATDLLALVEGQQPEGGKLLGGLRYEETGNALKTAPDVSFPVKLSDLQLPSGRAPDEAMFALVVPRKFEGVVVYELLDTMSFEATEPGQGRLVTRSPPFPGLLARRLAESQRAAVRLDTLSSVNVSSTDPAQVGVSVGAAVVALDVANSDGGKIAGIVKSAAIGPNGEPVSAERPVSGALVVLDDVNSERGAGFVRPGELVVTSDSDGAFAMIFRPSLQGRDREVRAAHPRFPFQSPRVGLVLPSSPTAVANVSLVFAESTAPNDGVRGQSPPVLSASFFPPLPPVSTNENSFAELVLSFFDDVQVTEPRVEVSEVRGPNGEELDRGLAQLAVEGGAQGTVSRRIQRYRVRASVRARVKITAQVFDNDGLEARLETVLNFGFSASVTPEDPNDQLGPFVSFVWPTPFSRSIPSLSPVLIRFSEPLNADDLQPAKWQDWLALDGEHRLTSVQASPDRRELTVYYEGNPEGDVSVSVLAPLRDRVGNSLDQNPATEIKDTFEWSFTQAGQRRGELEDAERGSGLVVQGRFGYGLEVLGEGGRLVVYDLENPGEPVPVDSLALSGRPTTLTLIPAYALPHYSVGPDGSVTAQGCEAVANFLGVYFGGVNELKRLSILPATGRVSGISPISGIITRKEAAQVVKSKWDPPFLGHLEFAEANSVTLLNLPAFHLGASLRVNQPEVLDLMPANGNPGRDENGDGDYCDAGDEAPLPFLDPVHPFGFAFSYAPDNARESLQDFDFLSGLGQVAVVTRFNDRSELDKFRMVLAANTTNSLENARVEFESGLRARRVLLLPAVRLERTGSFELVDLALVSLTRDAGGDGVIGLINVTDPARPSLFTNGPSFLPLPAGEGLPGSMVKRSDGLLALATSRSILLIDPTKLLLPGGPGPDGRFVHPAFVGRIALGAGGVRDFVADVSGVNGVFTSDTRTIVQTEPRFQVVTFNRDPFKPATLLDLPDSAKNALLSRARPVTVVEPAARDSSGDVVPDLAPDRHNYVIVDAPGGAADEEGLLPLVVAAISEKGQLYVKGAKTSTPAVLGDRSVHNALFLKQLLKLLPALASALGTGDEVGTEIGSLELLVSLMQSEKARAVVPQLQELARLWLSYPLDFKARRLSDDPASALYNRFLAGPFIVLPTSPNEGLVNALKDQAEQRLLDRRYLRASPRLWVGLPDDLEGNEVVGQFASDFRLNPRITLEGLNVPLVSSLAEGIIDFFVGGSDILGPAALFGLQAVVQRVAPVVGRFLRTDFDPTLLPGANTLRLVAYKDRPLIFVGGFGGSRLADNEGEFWPNLVRLRSDPTALAVAPNGDTFTPAFPTDTLRHVLEIGPVRLANIYGGLIKNLKFAQGYVEYDYFNPQLPNDTTKEIQFQRRRLRGQPNLNQEPVPDLFVFAYDWRLDNTKAAELLKEYLDLVRVYHPDADGVDLMAHSNGNLVARKFMLNHPDAVKRFISLCAPWLGSGKPFTGILTGDMEDITLNFAAPINDLRRAVQFMPGFHQLMENKGVFDLGFRPVIEAGFDLNRNGKAFELYNYSQYADALENSLMRESHAEVGFRAASPSRRNHEEFHEPPSLPIANWSTDSAAIEVHQIVGMQTVPRSAAGVILAGRLHQQGTNVDNVTFDLPPLVPLDFEAGVEDQGRVGEAEGPLPTTTNHFRFRADYEFIKTLGDGTVPILSLARGFGANGGLNYNAPHARMYCMVSSAAAKDDEMAGHNPMLNHPLVHEWIGRILEGRRIDQLGVAPVVPASVTEGSLFDVGASVSSPRPGGGTVTTLFDFGDGSSSARAGGLGQPAQAQHRYRQSGRYVISIGANLGDELMGFTSAAVDVANVAPSVQILGGDTTVVLNETRTFTARVFDPGLDDTHTFRWFLNDRALVGQSGFAAAINFVSLGEQRLRVVATDTDGATGAVQIVVQVVPSATAPAPSPSALPGLAAASAPSLPFFEEQPKAFIRITGHAPGPLDTKGISVRQRGVLAYGFQEYLMPFLSQPVQDLAAFLFLVKRAAGVAVDAVVQRTAQDTSTIDLFQDISSGGSGALDSTIEFTSKGGPLEIEMLYSEGGTPLQYNAWTTNVPPSQSGTLQFFWPSSLGTPLLEPVVRVGSVTVPLKRELLGPRAADRIPPSVVAIHNPASGNVTVEAQDNFTDPSRIELFLVQDSSGDGELTDEIFQELKTNVLVHTLLPSRKFAVVARDEIGNVSSMERFLIQTASDYTYRHSGPGGYCDSLQAIREAVGTAIQNALDEPVVSGMFLLDRAHLWIFEQGSGACLWKANSCQECNGNFIPKISDNDFQLILPAHLERNYQLTTTDRAEFLASGPHDLDTRLGDWYFRAPSGLDGNGLPTTDVNLVATWVYQLPEGFTTPDGLGELLVPRAPFTGDLAEGFPDPLTPADIISKAFTEIVRNTPELRVHLRQTSFFPIRREHFMFGIFDLDLPPPFGDDPIADSGMGRQLLLLKFALEGAFVQAPGGVNQGLPSLDTLYENLRSSGVPLAEGFEWGLLQEFGALNAGVAVDQRAEYGPATRPIPLNSAAGNGLQEQQKKKLKTLGKSAIRAALARLAGDSETASLLFGISRQDYLARHVPSFEDYILQLLLGEPGTADELFGEFAGNRELAEGPDLRRFLDLKKAQDSALFNEIFATPGLYRLYVEQTLTFLRRMVQDPTREAYQTYLQGLPAIGLEAERAQRIENLQTLLRGVGPSRPGLIDLRRDYPDAPIEIVFGIKNYADVPATGLTVRANPEPPAAPPAFQAAAAPAPPAPDNEVTQTDIPILSASGNDDTEDPTLSVGAPLSPGESERTQIATIDPAVMSQTALPSDNGVTTIRDEFPVDEDFEEFAPVLVLYLVRDGREQDVLEDWKALPDGHPRSPRFVLGKLDSIRAAVYGKPGLGTLQAVITSQTDPIGINLQLTAGSASSTVYQGEFRLSDLPGISDAIAVTEEEVVRVSVDGTGLPSPLVNDVMVDFGELSIATLKHLDRSDELKPRFDYRDFLLNRSDGPRLADAGFVQFDDDVAAVTGGGNNPMRQFLQAFADPAKVNNGEADFLYVHTHGAKSGELFDHISDQEPDAAFRTMILDPILHLSASGLWRRDADFFISEACVILTPDEGPQGQRSGATNWIEVLRASPRPLHGILGFARTKGASRPGTRNFLTRVIRGKPLRNSWQRTMQDRDLPWGTIFYLSAFRDTAFEVSRDPQGLDDLLHEDFQDAVPDLCQDPVECCGADGVRLEVRPGLWAASNLLDAARSQIRLPASARLSVAPVLGPAARRQGTFESLAGTESVEVAESNQAKAHGASDPSNAVHAAWAYLTNVCELPAARLRLAGVGAVRETLVSRGRPPQTRVRSHVVRFELQEHGLPILDSFVTVELGANGVQEVRASEVPALELEPDANGRGKQEAVRGLLESLERARPRLGSPHAVIDRISLGWKLPAEGSRGPSAQAIPVWRVEWRPTSAEGAAIGGGRTLLIHATRGEFVEVSE